MDRKEMKVVAVIATVCVTILNSPISIKSEEMEKGPSVGQGIAGISLSINNYYRKTYSSIRSTISMTDAFYNTRNNNLQDNAINIEYKNIGIANVSDFLNIREKADESSSVVGILPKYGGCYIDGLEQNGWAKVRSGNVSGYVLSNFLVTGGEVPALAKKVALRIGTINTAIASIYEKKSMDSTTLASIPEGEEIDVLDDSDKEWLYVRIDNDKGYISRDLVDVKYQLAKATGSEEDAGSSIRNEMVSYAKKFLGGKYVYGGTSLTEGIDCSAFMMRIYEHFGYHITRTSRSQAKEGKEIKLSEVKPGDLVFYDQNGTIHHVAMYIGNGKIIHASNPISGIKISNMYYKMPFKAARFLND